MGVSPLSRRAYLYDHTTPRQVSGRTHSAYLKIAEGCDRPCAFCIIPKLRGPQRSRTIESIAAEAEMLVSNGARELCLVAQDLTTYGTDLDEQAGPRAAARPAVPGQDLRWIRLHYAFPTTVTDGLIKQIASEPKIATYIDVPLQHVDTDVLKRCAGATRRRSCATWSSACGRSRSTSGCARRCWSATRARPRRRSSGSTTSSRRARSTTSGCSRGRARTARRRRCCPPASTRSWRRSAASR
jgi:tRNA A37 methylthiotransferase MiaB